MEFTLLLAMGAFSLGMSISPGPVNMVIVASGATHGLRRTLPFVSGATLGFTALLILVGCSLARVLESYPAVMMALEWTGAAFICHLGYRIATATPEPASARATGAAPGFLQGAALQWLNAKAWIACAAGAALFSDPRSAVPFVVFVAIYCAICYLSLLSWAVLGDSLSSWLRVGTRMRTFNRLMGGLLIASALYLVLGRAV